MGTISPASPERMYPWWWDSHVNPKNSKWLHENLTGMDAKVKQMIKLIEEDADSFARRAEMYYKKRPELMKLVEDFYQAYRALAGRYDHVAGVLRQAHRTVAEVFPNQVPFALVDDLPAGLSTEAYPGSPQMFTPFDLGELGKDALQISPPDFHAGRRNGASVQQCDSFAGLTSLDQSNDLIGSGEGAKLAKSAERRARKSLNFQDSETIRKEEDKSAVDNPKAQVPSESERMGKAEVEILTLKTALSSLETEKHADLLQYQQSLERLTNLELEVSLAKKDSNGLNERASKAETEVNTLKESLEKLDAERHASLLQYQQCVDKTSNLETYISRSENDAGQLNERASKAETEAQTLTHDLTKLEAEKESSLVLYNQCLEKVSDMEGKLQQAKEAARRSNDRADKADKEVEALMQALAMLVDEKEAAAIKYNNCLETIALLEHKLKFAEEDSKRLNSKIDDGVAKFRSAEERSLQLERSNHMLHSDLETSAQKVAAQNEELIEKQKELSRIWTCLQEERLRYVETQNAFQSLQRSDSQSQEELRSLAAEIQKREGTIEELKAANKGFTTEVEQINVENKGLNEVNLSLALTVKDLKAEISCSRETIGKLEAEVELRVHQRNALQQEIYGTKEELKSLNMKYQAFSVLVESLGIGSDSFVTHIKNMQNQNVNLEKICNTVKEEKVACLEKLTVMDKLVEKNAILEDSLSDMNMELDAVRDKVKALEESCKLLRDENTSLISNEVILVSQLQMVTDNLDKLSEEKSCLEKSLTDANYELEEWRGKSRCFKGSHSLLEKRSCSRDGEIDQLKDRVAILDVQNRELKAQIKEYSKAINSLREFVTTLENGARVDAPHQGDNKETKETRMDTTLAVCADIHLEMIEEPHSMLLGEYVDLNELQIRIKAVEKLITEREKHLFLENSTTKSKLDAAMKQLEDLKSKSNVHRPRTTKVKHINARLENDDFKPQKAHEISEEGSEMVTKDIMLDGSSECSSIGFSRTSTVETNDPLEIWEDAFHEGSIDLTVGNAPKVQRSRSEKKQQREQHERRSTHAFVDKEVSVDNLEVPRRTPGPCHDANERKVLERLDSDAQKLTNLHITVQDLKRTVEMTEKTRKGTTTGIEYGNVKEQLEESEEAVIKLFNLNLRLKRNFENESFSLEETSALAFEEKKSIRRRKVTEQARRMSEKIGRLQLEVQKLQFLLMKLEDESKPRQKIKIAERKTRVLLRDYLYTSGTRTTRQRPKRGNFCACAQPSTKGD